MALVTRSALSRQTLWLSLFWARLDRQAPGLTCSGRRNCTVLSPAANIPTPGSGDREAFTDHTSLFSRLLFALPSLPAQRFSP